MIAPLGAAGCQLPPPFSRPDRPSLRPGIRVEVEGARGSEGLALEVDEKEFDEDLEITAPLLVQEDGAVLQLGTPLVNTAKTSFENADKETVEPFALETGDWIRTKGAPAGDTVAVRKFRQHEEQERWEVEGLVTEVDGTFPGETSGGFSVGPYRFLVDEHTDFTLFDDNAEWRDFLEKGPLAQRATKEQTFLPFTVPLGDRSRLGGQIAMESTVEDNYDLLHQDERDKVKLSASAQLAVLTRIGETGLFYAKGEWKTDHDLKEARPDDLSQEIEPQEFYLYLPIPGLDGASFQVGRQELDERREWLYSENVDALRLYYDRELFQWEASLSKTPHLLEASHEPAHTNLVGVVTYKATDRWRIAAYVIDRRSHDLEEFSPFLFGLRSSVKPDIGVSHWLELGRSDGIVEGRRLQGWAIDAGATYVVDRPMEPSATAGLAMGSGGRKSEHLDRNFRQSGLQDNNGKFNGVTSFRYYGEILDPELSNLQVATLGLGLRPLRNLSVDVVMHGYRQVEARSDTLFSDLDRTPNGLNRGLGREADLIVGYRGPTITAEFVAARFEPGSGFDDDGAAWLTALQLRTKF